MGCISSHAGDPDSPNGQDGSPPSPAQGLALERPKGHSSPFLQRHAPNGEVWADYVAASPPSVVGGRLAGVWAECVYAGVVFELTTPGWDKLPEYRKRSPVGIICEYCEACGYGRKYDKAFSSYEDSSRKQLQGMPMKGDRAFLKHNARNTQTWEEYLKFAKPAFDMEGKFINGAWGECITAAVIFEHENPKWDELGPFSADGPAGQVIACLESMRSIASDVKEALLATETATHSAVEKGRSVPVFDMTCYQPPVYLLQALQVNQPPPTPSGRKKAVLIGCNYPGQEGCLRGSDNDVRRWRDLLTNQYGFQASDIVQLTDEGHSKFQCFSTRQNMLSAIRWLVEDAEPGDVLFFHFAGHGGQRDVLDESELDGMDEVLLPSDYMHAGVIVDYELFDLLIAPIPAGCKLTVVLDCCHSGYALDVPYVWNSINERWDMERYPWHTAGDVQMFTSFEDPQGPADPADLYSRPAGAITTALCDALETHGHQPVRIHTQLLTSMQSVLTQKGYLERPRLRSSQAFDVNKSLFHLTDHIIPNLNPQLGQTQPPRPKPPRFNLGPFRF
mmetsp:Transcript_12497/g.29438  ORF Transcript_12497/g.29438 Transcript_12497/m.29438 type:complete len:561 (+) Transcript_12497:72-1754(+)